MQAQAMHAVRRGWWWALALLTAVMAGWTFAAVPPDRAMIRTSYMATHTRDHLDRALEAIAKVGRELGVIQ